MQIEKKSVALGLILQHTSRTLRDEEVESITKLVVDSMHKRNGAVLRA